MKIKLFENSANVTQGNTYGMGNIGAPQPKQPNEEDNKNQHIEPEKPIEEPKNESVVSFSKFHLNEDGGVAMATLGNTAGMGNVTTPPVSTNGSINTYTGNGSPTETVGRGSGDIAATSKSFLKNPAGKKKRKASKESTHFGTNQPKESMYVTSYTDWLTPEATNESQASPIEILENKIFNLEKRIEFLESITKYLRPI